MVVELVNTGSELMLGRVLNTHQQWLGRRLSDLGYSVTRQVAVPDAHQAIAQAVREALTRADLTITTGGLGPTTGDLTREAVAQLLGRELREDADLLEHIRSFFAARRRPIPERTRVQALVPDGALVLPNAHGTAPGLAIQVRPNPFRAESMASWLILLPGPPRELQPMFANAVVPLLRRVLPVQAAFVCTTLRTTGLGESLAQERIVGPLQTLVTAGLEIGYCARPGSVDVRLTASGGTAAKLVRDAEEIVQAQLAPYIFGRDDEELEAVVIRMLTERKQTLAVAESCTGGCLAHRLTNVPGASEAFLTGLVTYSNAAKQQLLGVRSQTLVKHGAVSEAVAREMAAGARALARADFGLAVTGIAGPGGGTPEKPVGTVFVALAAANGTEVRRLFNPLDRLTFKEITTQQALDWLRSRLTQAH